MRKWIASSILYFILYESIELIPNLDAKLNCCLSSMPDMLQILPQSSDILKGRLVQLRTETLKTTPHDWFWNWSVAQG